MREDSAVKVMLWVAATAVVVTAAIVTMGGPASAHHASGPFYDNTKRIGGSLVRPARNRLPLARSAGLKWSLHNVSRRVRALIAGSLWIRTNG